MNNKLLTSLRNKFYKQVWICNSTVHERITMHNVDKVVGCLVQPPVKERVKWISALNDRKFMWRFALFVFDAETKEYDIKVTPVEEPMESKHLNDFVIKHLSEFSNETEVTIDSWGWVAIPDSTVDIGSLEYDFVEYFSDMGIFDIDTVAIREQIKKLERASL